MSSLNQICCFPPSFNTFVKLECFSINFSCFFPFWPQGPVGFASLATGNFRISCRHSISSAQVCSANGVLNISTQVHIDSIYSNFVEKGHQSAFLWLNATAGLVPMWLWGDTPHCWLLLLFPKQTWPLPVWGQAFPAALRVPHLGLTSRPPAPRRLLKAGATLGSGWPFSPRPRLPPVLRCAYVRAC